MSINKIPLFWWSEPRLMGKKKENYGDLLSKYLVEKISGRQVKWVQPKKQRWFKFNKANYLAVGSILAHANTHSIVWGSGINDLSHPVAKADFRAVRGPKTRNYLIRQGCECPEVYGDPALLLPAIYKPQINKKYKLGIIPHYNDFQKIFEIYGKVKDVKVIHLMTDDIERTTDEIIECEKIISSSLHGTIVAHAYGIPAICVRFSDKVPGDGIKYSDYYESIGINNFKMPEILEVKSVADILKLFSEIENLPDIDKLNALREKLLNNFPIT